MKTFLNLDKSYIDIFVFFKNEFGISEYSTMKHYWYLKSGSKSLLLNKNTQNMNKYGGMLK